MEKFWSRIGSGCRNFACDHVSSKSHHHGKHNHNNNKDLPNSIMVDVNEQISWDDQGKPLMKPTGIIGPPANHRLSIAPNHSGNVLMNGVASITIVSQSQDAKYSEVPRFLLSYVYMFLLGLANSLVVVIAHDWAPDRKQFLPLPDLILNNVPYVPWAFHACEGTAGVIFFIFVLLMCVHKHRFVILRRLFIIYGSVLLMRCPAMLLTSLSIPSHHLQCEPMMNDTMWSKLQRAGDLYLKFGMSSQGVRTCGDYMFSGHTIFISLLNFIITEYTPILFLHILSWALTVLAISLIMVAHVHYSIDVLIAFFLTALYFNYYHTLANHHNPHDPGPIIPPPPTNSLFRKFCLVTHRLRIWVPFYSYLEKMTAGSPIPHEFESPLTALLRFTRTARHRIIAGKSRLV